MIQAATSASPPASTASGGAAWQPEDPAFWQATGARVARRTLWITTGALFLSFATWFIWSAVAARMAYLGFDLTVGQRFWLASMPGLVGATLRIPYSFVVQRFGTRLVVTLATASLLVPSIGVGLVVRDPTTPYWLFLVLAAFSGFGGGNFSAFMSSTSLFYPKAKQGTALGIQAGLGNFGVSAAQFLIPAVITVPLFGGLGGGPLTFTRAGAHAPMWIQNAAFIWTLPVAFFTVAAAVGLRSIPVKASLKEQAVIFRRKHNWIMTSLYFMTFGTFSGLAASFPLLIQQLFGKLPGGPDPLRYAFLGALIGSATRPPGGWISDKLGGARVTLACGAALLASAVGVTFFTGPALSNFGPFMAFMLLLFFASGVGNGSTFRMIPMIFPRQEAAPVLGWTAAVAAYGSFIVPMAFSFSLGRFGSPNPAFLVFAAFYAANLGLCWWYYARRGAEHPC